MLTSQIITLTVLVVTIAALASGRFRADITALAAAAILLATNTVRPIEVQSAFASPAIIALASLFVITYAMELTGLLGLLIRRATIMCGKLGATGLWIIIIFAGVLSAFLNNTPLVLLGAPVVRDAAQALNLPAKRFLIPLSYMTILGGTCTLIGTSTNLLVNDMARNAGEPTFGMFEIAPVGICLAVVGGIYLLLAGTRLLSNTEDTQIAVQAPELNAPGDDAALYPADRPFLPLQAMTSLLVFVCVVLLAALGWAPIAASAFFGAVLLVSLKILSIDDAYRGLRPDILFLISGMVVVGIAVEVTGLATTLSAQLMQVVNLLGPYGSLALLYGVTLILTEFLSNAAVAVLMAPIAVALAETLGVNTRPFLVCVMMAASAAFATPFGYQTNVLVYQIGRYSYLDFLRMGLPLNILTWLTAMVAIPHFFPF